MYLLKHETEYGEVNYVTDNLDNNPLEFKTILEAEKKAEELLDMEYDDFGSAITKYYITEIRDEPLKYIKSFKVCDDGKECILIDDQEKNIEEWETIGGTGILYKNAEQTLTVLKKMGVL